ncbi:unnamed protein product [Ambrosiozyma monospora]|uniref:Unnamed protein product n=1 Tax=Ambrosiozyma monospora TaxID=43982 RepID=A0ACB5TBA5_AMBMO|nr:unnamed protein product [Ambrosiozyma monospora]
MRLPRLPTFLFSILALASLSHAFTPYTLNDEGIYNNLTHYIEYSSAAGCISTTGVKVGYLDSSCSGEACVNADSDIYVVNVVDSLSHALILTDPSEEQIIIAFQGTESFLDWVLDFSFVPVAYEPYAVENDLATNDFDANLPFVHLGFKTATDNFLSNATGVLKGLKEEYPNYSVIVTGHSLGGALASLTGVELYLMGYEPTVIAYASPKVFNPTLADWVNEVFKTDQYLSDLKADNVHQIPYYTFTRVTHVHDIVPCVPLAAMGYDHAGVDYYITKQDLPQAISDVEVRGEFKLKYELETLGDLVASVAEDPSAALKDDTTSDSHIYYFIDISQCGLADEESS